MTAPVSNRFGVQVDALSGKVNSSSASGYGLHAFWRDSDKGLVGLTGSQVKSNGNKMNRTGLEGEYYLPNVTVAGVVAKQRGDVPKADYGRLDLRWYPNDNLAIDLGGSKADNFDKQHIGVEYQTKVKGLSLFADAAKGDNNYDHVLGGITYYFGGNKSLKQRHREDDPVNPLFEAVQDLGANVPVPQPQLNCFPIPDGNGGIINVCEEGCGCGSGIGG